MQVEPSIVISLIALATSIISTAFALKLSRKLATEDYRASENVKSDLATLISSLRIIREKCVAMPFVENNEICFSEEKKTIATFLNSNTCFAFQAWCNKKSKDAESTNKKSEPWRSLISNLILISVENNIVSAAVKALQVELLFDSLTQRQILLITKYNSNLIKSISELKANRDSDVSFRAIKRILESKQKQANNENEIKSLRQLKEEGYSDPSIDFHLALYHGDDEKCALSIEAGADVNLTIKELLSRYHE